LTIFGQKINLTKFWQQKLIDFFAKNYFFPTLVFIRSPHHNVRNTFCERGFSISSVTWMFWIFTSLI